MNGTTTRVENSARWWEALCRHRLMVTFTYRGAEMWMNTRQAVLDGRTPLEAIRAGHGERVHELIEQIEGGAG